MQGLASIMTGAPASEVIAFLREAFSRFDAVAGRSGRDMRRYATRSQLLLADFCCQGGLFGEANAALMRAQNQAHLLPSYLPSNPTSTPLIAAAACRMAGGIPGQPLVASREPKTQCSFLPARFHQV